MKKTEHQSRGVIRVAPECNTSTSDIRGLEYSAHACTRTEKTRGHNPLFAAELSCDKKQVFNALDTFVK